VFVSYFIIRGNYLEFLKVMLILFVTFYHIHKYVKKKIFLDK